MSDLEIKIRRAESNDASEIRKIFEYSNVIHNTLQLPFPSTEIWAERLKNSDESTYELLAVANTVIVGDLCLKTFPDKPRRKHVGEFSIVVRDDWCGKGIGSALMRAMIDLADNWLNLLRLELYVYTDNEAAIHLYTKFGFTIEGTHSKSSYRNGQYSDTYSMVRFK